MCTSYKLPLNLVFCTNVVQHYPIDLICCRLKAISLLAKGCKHLMLLRLKQERRRPSTPASFCFPLPSPDCTCDCYWEVPTSATELCGTVAVYKLKQKMNVVQLLKVLLLFFFYGIVFPLCFTPFKSKLQQV